MIELTPIGFTTKPYGKEGLIKLSIEDRYLESLEKADSLFININGSKVPHLLEGIEFSRFILAKFEDINNPQEATTIGSKELFLENKYLPDDPNNDDLSSHQWLSFKIYNQDNEYLGTIKEIVEYPQQVMLTVASSNGEHLIPLHEDFIISLNDLKGEIVLQLPDGILDLN